MPSLTQQLETDYITAYKAKEQEIVGVLRMLKTAIKNRQIELKCEPNDEQVMEIIAKQVKQRKESIDMFTKAGRDELAAKEAGEMEILMRYMPSQLSSEELEQAIDALIAETGADGMKDMGKVMGALNAAYKGRIDGREASTLVKTKLSA